MSLNIVDFLLCTVMLTRSLIQMRQNPLVIMYFTLGIMQLHGDQSDKLLLQDQLLKLPLLHYIYIYIYIYIFVCCMCVFRLPSLILSRFSLMRIRNGFIWFLSIVGRDDISVDGDCTYHTIY